VVELGTDDEVSVGVPSLDDGRLSNFIVYFSFELIEVRSDLDVTAAPEAVAHVGHRAFALRVVNKPHLTVTLPLVVEQHPSALHRLLPGELRHIEVETRNLWVIRRAHGSLHLVHFRSVPCQLGVFDNIELALLKLLFLGLHVGDLARDSLFIVTDFIVLQLVRHASPSELEPLLGLETARLVASVRCHVLLK